MFYEFDYNAAQEDLNNQCFHMLAKTEDHVPVFPSSTFPITDKYRYFESTASFQCCLNEGSLSSINTSYEQNNIFGDQQDCHITEGIKFKDYLNYGVLNGADGYVKDVLLSKVPFGDPDSKPVSLCGNNRSKIQKYMAEGRFDQYEQAVDGRFVMFFYDLSATKIELLGIIANRCLVTPEFAQFTQPEIFNYDIYKYTQDMDLDKTVTF